MAHTGILKPRTLHTTSLKGQSLAQLILCSQLHIRFYSQNHIVVNRN